MNPESLEFEKTLAEQMYEAYHERMFSAVPIPLRDREKHVRDTWQYLASLSVGFVTAADVSPDVPEPSVN